MGTLQRRDIEVYADWAELGGPIRMGLLHPVPARGTEVFAFEYDASWLRCGHTRSLDPALQLLAGRQYAPPRKANFGLFLGSSPDRWGRVLMDRREVQEARREGRARRQLRDSDYLLGVHDAQRMGALRFKSDPSGPFLDDNEGLATPPWTWLRRLEQASLEIERYDAEKDDRFDDWLRMLIAPGASLGGARPKAGVLDPKGHLWIAKFPGGNDRYDIGAWEFVAHQLARFAGITVAESDMRKFNVEHRTFLTKRFDRTPAGDRRHFASAMTLLNRKDGDHAASGVSYLHLAELLAGQGARTNSDLEQLWRRLVFNICISNSDDHLRNHGFLLESKVWVLSPAYDMNPNPDADGLTLNISDQDNAQDLDLAHEVRDFFRIGALRANAIVAHVVQVVRQWREVADAADIPIGEQDRMARAFRIAEAV